MRIIIVCLLGFMFNAAFATTIPTPEKLSLNIRLHYKQRDANGAFNEYLLKDTLKTEVANHQWQTIQNMTESTIDQYILLGKIADADANSVTLKFLVLNTGSNPGIISSPTMIVKYGKKGELTINEPNQNIHLSIVAAK